MLATHRGDGRFLINPAHNSICNSGISTSDGILLEPSKLPVGFRYLTIQLNITLGLDSGFLFHIRGLNLQLALAVEFLGGLNERVEFIGASAHEVVLSDREGYLDVSLHLEVHKLLLNLTKGLLICGSRDGPRFQHLL